MGGAYRSIDSFIANFGFRVQYNRMFKPEYLPARIKYNGFFFFSALALMYGANSKNVSASSLSYNRCYRYFRCGVSLMRVRPIWVNVSITASLAVILIQSPTLWISQLLHQQTISRHSLSERTL